MKTIILSGCFLVLASANVAAAPVAASSGDYLDIPVNGDIDPIWENLRGDPRFERFAQISLDHWRKERREVLAMHLF
jgi:hypothetical protein